MRRALGLLLGACVGLHGQALPVRNGSFESLERMAFGSCNDQFQKQFLWPAIRAREPQFWLWMGDAIYADYKEPLLHLRRDATPELMRAKYELQLKHPEYAEFRQEFPVAGVWDDHDFGRNDGDRTFPHREESQRQFLDFIEEPTESTRRQQQGVYTSYTFGSGDRTVKFVLLDVRYNKDPYGTAGGDFLGPAQWTWLEAELSASTAAFNVIVSGIQILPTDRYIIGEQWGRFPPQRERLLNLLLASNLKGVILLSGDVHFAEINQVQCNDNLVTEVTSSGMTHSWDNSHEGLGVVKTLVTQVFRTAQHVLPWEFRLHQYELFGDLNFGELEIDWHADPVPEARVRILDEHGETQLEYVYASKPFKQPKLKKAESLAPTCRAIREEELSVVVVRWLFMVGLVGLMVVSLPLGVALSVLLVYRTGRRRAFAPLRPRVAQQNAKAD